VAGKSLEKTDPDLSRSASERTGSHRTSRRGEKEQTLIDEQTGSRRRGGPHDDVTVDGLDASAVDEEEEFEEEQDDEGEDMTGERDYPVPPGWDYDDLTNEEFWAKVFAVEHAMEESPAEGRKALRAHGFLSEGHFSWTRERFLERHGGDTNFQESMINARKAHQHLQLRQAVGAELLEPIEEVSLELYATVQARRAALPSAPDAFRRLLAAYDLDEKKWTRIDLAWQARMCDPANAVATDSVNSEYRRLFAAATARLGRR